MFVKRLIQILFLFATMIFAQGTESAIPVAEPAPAPVPVAQPAVAAPAPAPVAQPAIAVPAPSDTNKSTISVFVKSPEELRQLKEELKNLQTMAGDSNPEIAALLERANRVAAMNDRCSSISINDLLRQILRSGTACFRKRIYGSDRRGPIGVHADGHHPGRKNSSVVQLLRSSD